MYPETNICNDTKTPTIIDETSVELDSIILKHFEHSFYYIFHFVLFHPNVKSSSSKVFYCNWAIDQLESSFPFLVVLFVREQQLLQILLKDRLLKLVQEVLCLKIKKKSYFFSNFGFQRKFTSETISKDSKQ